MAPRRKAATRRQGAIAAQDMAKPSKALPQEEPQEKPQEKPQGRRLRSSVAPASAIPPTTHQTPIPSQEHTSPSRSRKRRSAVGDEKSRKRLRRSPQPALISPRDSQELAEPQQTRLKKRVYVAEEEEQDSKKRPRQFRPESPQRLSKQNLRILESLTGSEHPSVMDAGAPPSERPRKRSPSRRTSQSDLSQGTPSAATEKSSATNSFYRYFTLDRAGISVCPEPPPSDVQTHLNKIFKRTISDQRKQELGNIAKITSQKFIEVLRGSHREDDLVELVHYALVSLDKNNTFSCPRKADWNPSLKPTVLQEIWDLHFQNPTQKLIPEPIQAEIDGAIDRPSKRQQPDPSYPSPSTPASGMPPPQLPSTLKQDASVKNPRPDFTVGFRGPVLSNELMERGLDSVEADGFLPYLQRQQMLCSDPTLNFLDARFPILVIEGKAYATGKTAFEAQNQAAVSGAYMINLQRQLHDLSASFFPDFKPDKTPLAFSICTEGPHMELWVHYSILKKNVRMYRMNIIKTCYGSLQGGVEEFLADLDRLMSWARDCFVKDVADQLYRLATYKKT